jgi:thiol-disulfide isomerase/thioredoxin
MRLIASVVAAAAIVSTASAQSLSIGDTAPNLANTTWVQGDAVSHWEAGKVYVLDFWAPWCGPCIASMPHVNELHKKYKDKGVTVVGVSIWPNDNMTPTTQFVAEHIVDADKNEKMLYSVAEDIDGATAKAFMESTGSNGIPTVMIVDQNGRLAWLGHPMDKDFDKSLEEVVEGRYDINAKAAQVRAAKALEAEAQPILAAARAAQGNGDWETLLVKLDELIALGYETESMTLAKIQHLALRMNRPQDAWATGWEFVRGPAAESPQRLNALAWFIVDNQALTSRDLDLAFEAASRANKMTGGEDWGILDTLAHVEFAKGNREKAIEIQKKAIEAAPARDKDGLREALERFEKGDAYTG